MISIVTATYNRAYILPQLYESLLRNKETYSDFEWVIIDDGSTDRTKQLVDEWIKEDKIKIIYCKQKNSGKMAALNYGMTKTKGDQIIEVDSDDYIIDGGLQTIKECFQEVEHNPNLYGILFRRSFTNPILDQKNNFPFEKKISKMFDLYMKTDFDKDAAPVFKGDIRRKFQHQLEHDEKFITEARMYNEMDKAYEGLLCINKPVVVCEYLEDGYSKNIDRLFRKNPYGYRCYFKECLEMDLTGIPFQKRLYLIKHYILFSYMTNVKRTKVIQEVSGFNRFLVLLLVIPGYIVSKKRFSR